ncbi:2'-5' RNA ligase family protein [Jannaschia formosa]|uniref:2'-5' RNA ligase family protein n=1 Tax=Jannaschia formosa TaxID=2259592 RepID=UPI001ADDE55A|nr:2'-5' RNA ligase family protein [Jannaschia formosa]
MSAPLVLTFRPDPVSRDRWFRPERNVVPAHLTLFHHLPGDRLPEVTARLAEVAAQAPALLCRVARLVSLGRGVRAHRGPHGREESAPARPDLYSECPGASLRGAGPRSQSARRAQGR